MGGDGSVAMSVKRVAVVAWQWDQSIHESSAVRMVPVRGWQWRYWQSYGCDKGEIKKKWQRLVGKKKGW
jgi:hypothetical protein